MNDDQMGSEDLSILMKFHFMNIMVFDENWKGNYLYLLENS